MKLCDFCYRHNPGDGKIESLSLQELDIELELCPSCLAKFEQDVNDLVQRSRSTSVRDLKCGLTPDQTAQVSGLLQYRGLSA